jgi:methyl-accepting chemotaxis protein
MKVLRSLKFLFITLFSGFIIIISVLTSVLGIRQLSNAVVASFAVQGIEIIHKAVSLVDGDAFEALVKSMDINDPFYEETRLNLLELKEDSGCLYLYTMSQVTGNTWQFVIDGSAEPDDEENFSTLGDRDDVSEYDNAFNTTLATGETTTSRLVYQEGWGWLISVYTPIFNSAGNIVGIVGCDFSGDHLHQAIRDSTIRLIILGGISVVIGFLLLLFFIQKIFTPINEIHVILKKIAKGEGDLTKRINIKDKSEIGELASDFNTTLEKIRQMIITIKTETTTLFDTGNDLAISMNETAAGINEITSSILEIKERVLSQSDYVSETHRTMDDVVSSIKKLNTNVEDQSTNISSATAAIEEMVSNTSSVTNTLIKNEANVHILKDAAEAGRNSLQEVAGDIQEIARESEGLLNINSVMNSIAAQTNLLSMNAAIEAAHAGEAGKGFAVVAGEIRKLAENSSHQSKIISDVLKKIKGSIDKIMRSTQNVLNKFEDIDSSVKIVAEQEEHIRNSMEEQQSGSRMILEGISNVNNITREVESGSQVMYKAANDVIKESSELDESTKEIAAGMNEMASGADQINLAINHIKNISGKNRENITVLVDEVSRFKI